MDSRNTLPITEARKRLFEIVEEVQKPATYYTLTERGKPKAAVLSSDELESYLETLEAMQDFPDLEKDVFETKNDLRTGRYRSYAALEDLLVKEGFISYGFSRRSKTQRRKGVR